MKKLYIIIASDSEQHLWAYGSPATNKPFTTEAAADRRRREMLRLAEGTGLNFIVVPLSDSLTAHSMTRRARQEAA